MEAHRAAAEARLGLPAGHPHAIHDDAYAAALAAWAAWSDVADDLHTLLTVQPATQTGHQTTTGPEESTTG